MSRRTGSAGDVVAQKSSSDEFLRAVTAVVADPAEAPKLHGLLHGEARAVIGELSEDFDVRDAYSDAELVRRLASIEHATERLVKAAGVVAYFGDRDDRQLLAGVLGHLANAFDRSGGQDVWRDLARYPAHLVMLGAAIGALAGRREELLGPLFLSRPKRAQPHRPD